jgi:hypothetical protein
MISDLWCDNATRWPIEIEDLHDGLHFGVVGNRKMADGLKSVIRYFSFQIDISYTQNNMPFSSLSVSFL